MKALALGFSMVLASILFYSCHCKRSRLEDTIFMHNVISEDLRDQIRRFDSLYGKHPEIIGRGISVSYAKYQDSTHFGIGYSAGINYEAPLIVCEPINNKPVVLHIGDLYDYVRISADNATEVQKAHAPNEYQRHNEAAEAGEELVVIDDSVNWIVKFDKNNNLVGVDTVGVSF